MAKPDLIEETHALLKHLLELEAERKRQLEEFKASREGKGLDTLKSEGEKTEGTEPKLVEDRLKQTREETRKRIEEMGERDRAYREAHLAELRRQTELLEQIASRLGA